ncbi:MAG: transposase, partial [Cyanobacteria bacterium J06634_6]
MNDASASNESVSARAFLAGIGAKLNGLNLFGPISDQVKIQQKTVKDSPSEKLYDGFIGILCGAGGLVEVNKLVRSDSGLQQAFGRERCAEQSVIQETLDASDAQNVNQIQSAMDEIYRQHSQGYRHDYDQALQVLDMDMSGHPCGPKAA